MTTALEAAAYEAARVRAGFGMAGGNGYCIAGKAPVYADPLPVPTPEQRIAKLLAKQIELQSKVGEMAERMERALHGTHPGRGLRTHSLRGAFADCITVSYWPGSAPRLHAMWIGVDWLETDRLDESKVELLQALLEQQLSEVQS